MSHFSRIIYHLLTAITAWFYILVVVAHVHSAFGAVTFLCYISFLIVMSGQVINVKKSKVMPVSNKDMEAYKNCSLTVGDEQLEWVDGYKEHAGSIDAQVERQPGPLGNFYRVAKWFIS